MFSLIMSLMISFVPKPIWTNNLWNEIIKIIHEFILMKRQMKVLFHFRGSVVSLFPINIHLKANLEALKVTQ